MDLTREHFRAFDHCSHLTTWIITKKWINELKSVYGDPSYIQTILLVKLTNIIVKRSSTIELSILAIK